MTRRVFETIHAECSMRNAQHGFEDFITVLPKLFEKAYETMYADDYQTCAFALFYDMFITTFYFGFTYL